MGNPSQMLSVPMNLNLRVIPITVTLETLSEHVMRKISTAATLAWIKELLKPNVPNLDP